MNDWWLSIEDPDCGNRQDQKRGGLRRRAEDSCLGSQRRRNSYSVFCSELGTSNSSRPQLRTKGRETSVPRETRISMQLGQGWQQQVLGRLAILGLYLAFTRDQSLQGTRLVWLKGKVFPPHTSFRVDPLMCLCLNSDSQ